MSLNQIAQRSSRSVLSFCEGARVMTRAKPAFLALASSAAMAACSGAPSPEEVDASLKAATAAAVPGAKAQSVEVVNPERSAATWRWTARIEDKVYACDADDRMRLPSCEAI